MCKKRGAHFIEIRISTNMVAMHMGIKKEGNGLSAQAADRSFYFGAYPGKLVVYHKNMGFTHKYANIPPPAP
jgi:hypothetical protein